MEEEERKRQVDGTCKFIGCHNDVIYFDSILINLIFVFRCEFGGSPTHYFKHQRTCISIYKQLTSIPFQHTSSLFLLHSSSSALSLSLSLSLCMNVIYYSSNAPPTLFDLITPWLDSTDPNTNE